MLHVDFEKEMLKIRETPDIQLIAALIVLIVSYILMRLLMQPLQQTSFLLIIFLGAVLFGSLVLTFTSSTITVKLNKESRLITVEKRSLTKSTFKIYPFRDVADMIYLDELKNHKGEISYKLLMPLKSGEEIELLNMSSARTGKYFNAANFMNDIIYDSPEQVQVKLSSFNEQ